MSIELGTGSTENKLERLAIETGKLVEAAENSAVSLPIVIPFHAKKNLTDPFLTTNQNYMHQAGLSDFIGRHMGSDEVTISLRGLLNESFLQGQKTLLVQGYFQVEGRVSDAWMLMWRPQKPAITDHCYMPVISPFDRDAKGAVFNTQIGFSTELRTDFPDYFDVPDNLEVKLQTNGGDDAKSSVKGSLVIQAVIPCPKSNQNLIRT